MWSKTGQASAILISWKALETQHVSSAEKWEVCGDD